MYYNYYGTMIPDYRGTYDDERFWAAAPLTAGLLGLGIGYLGAELVNRPYCCPPYPWFGPGFGYGGYPGYGIGFGPGFGGYGYPGIRPRPPYGW